MSTQIPARTTLTAAPSPANKFAWFLVVRVRATDAVKAFYSCDDACGRRTIGRAKGSALCCGRKTRAKSNSSIPAWGQKVGGTPYTDKHLLGSVVAYERLAFGIGRRFRNGDALCRAGAWRNRTMGTPADLSCVRNSL